MFLQIISPQDLWVVWQNDFSVMIVSIYDHDEDSMQALILFYFN